MSTCMAAVFAFKSEMSFALIACNWPRTLLVVAALSCNPSTTVTRVRSSSCSMTATRSSMSSGCGRLARRRLSCKQCLYWGACPTIESDVSWRLCAVIRILSSNFLISPISCLRTASVSCTRFRKAASVVLRASDTSWAVLDASCRLCSTSCLLSPSSAFASLTRRDAARSHWPSVSVARRRRQSSEAIGCRLGVEGALPAKLRPRAESA
mmetsp:Transcript_21535/g.52406  ORF Transcript_21535/g.52406 Transcript_21535/m.52406 type:complete len:210 (+) Transcript_21535:212-841(+)